MEQVLPDGKVKVTGVAVNEAWRQKHEEAKRKREERWKNNPRLREKYEARKKEREQAQQLEESQDKALVEERVRKKMIAEMYELFGFSEDYVEQQKNKMEEFKNKADRKTDMDVYMELAADADNEQANAATNKKEAELLTPLSIGGQVVGLAGTAAGFAGVGGVAIGATALTLSGLLTGVGAILTLISLPFAIKSIKKKLANMNRSEAVTANKRDAQMEQWNVIQKKLDATVVELQASEPMLVEKYKTMKKEDFNLYLKGYVASVMKKVGLSNDKVNEAVKIIEENAKNQVNKQPETEKQEENKGGEEKTEEEPEQTEEKPEKDGSEQENEPEEKEGEQPTEEVEEKEEPEQTAEEPTKEEPEQTAEEPAKEEPEQQVENEQPETVQVSEAEQQEEIQVEAVPVENVPEGAEIQTAEVVEEQPQAKTDEAFLDAMKQQPQENNEVEGPSVNTVSPQEIEKAKQEMAQEIAENTKETETSATEMTIKVPKGSGAQKIVIDKDGKGVEIEQMGE